MHFFLRHFRSGLNRWMIETEGAAAAEANQQEESGCRCGLSGHSTEPAGQSHTQRMENLSARRRRLYVIQKFHNHIFKQTDTSLNDKVLFLLFLANSLEISVHLCSKIQFTKTTLQPKLKVTANCSNYTIQKSYSSSICCISKIS